MKNASVLIMLLMLLLGTSCSNSPTDMQNSSETDSKKDTSVKVIAQEVDTNLVSFEKKLSLQGISYDIKVKGNGSLQKLEIVPSGLTNLNEPILMEVDPVINAEIEDMDSDGFPELLIYTQTVGSGSYGQVIGFSPNKGKSLSQINFPELPKDSKESKGYMGHDSFSLVEGSLVRRFPCYESNNDNVKPTGKLRQLQYKLKNGEASKQLVLVGFLEFDNQK